MAATAARLAEDHANAARLADGLRGLGGFTVDGPHTNMVFVHLAAARRPALAAHLREAGIMVPGGYGPTLRLVTRLDVDAEGIDRAIESFARFLDA